MNFLNKYFSLNKKDGKSTPSLVSLFIGGICILPPFAFFLGLPTLIFTGALVTYYYFKQDQSSLRACLVGFIMTLVGFASLIFLL